MAVAALLLAAGCRSSSTAGEPWCAANHRADFVRTPAERAAQAPADRRSDLRQLELGRQLCGWRR